MNRRRLLGGFTAASLVSMAASARTLAAVQPQEAPLPEVPYAPKPVWQEGVLPPFISATPGSGVKPPEPNRTGMRQRRYQGRVNYLDSNRKEIGREFFMVTIQPDGVRTLRGLAEMDDFRLLRDVVITVDDEWRGRDGYIRLMTEENFIGSSWLNFTDDGLEVEAFTDQQGRVSQRHHTDERPRGGGAHLLHGDSWTAIAYRQAAHGFPTGTGFSNSIQSNGGGGTLMNRGRGSRAEREYLGKEVKQTAAGAFNTEHMRTTFNVGDAMDIWAMGEDAIPCYQTHTWPDAPTKIFELAELSGDYR